MTRSLALAVAAAILLAGCATGPREPVAPSSDAGFSTTAVFAGEYDTTGPFARVVAPGAFSPLPPEVAYLESALDGVPIQLAIVRPDVPAGTKVPIILWTTGYLADLEGGYPADLDGEPLMGQVGAGGRDVAFYVENFVPHGYAVAVLALRGTAGSGGCPEVSGPRERADALQALDWLARQEWTTGRVGVTGLSWEGVAAWQLAGSGHPAVRTVVPIGTWDAWNVTFRNGTGTLYAVAAGPAIATRALFEGDLGSAAERACASQAELTVAGAASLAAPSPSHPSATPFAERAWRDSVERNYTGSVLLVHGLREGVALPHNAYPWIHRLEERGVVVKHVIGQWGHQHPDLTQSPTVRWDWAEILLHWFDRWLKDDASVDLGPIVQVADSDGRWRSEEAWPPRDAQPLTYHLTAEALETNDAAPPGSAWVFPDAGHMATDVEDHGLPAPCAGCLELATEPLPLELRFAGLPRLHLTVTPAGPGGWLTARLFVDHAGERRWVGFAQMDLRYADGGHEPEAVEAGAPLVARMEFEPLDVVVPRGARLGLQVSHGGNGDAPGGASALTDAVRLLTYRYASPILLPVRVELGGASSTLTIDTFARQDDAFFATPGASA